MLGFGLILLMCTTLIKAQEGEIMVPDNKTVCLNDLLEWCDSMQYPQQGAGLTVLSIVYEDPNGYYRVFCSSDSEGTNCTRNTLPWFSCSQDHALTYKGQLLTNETSTDDIDEDICVTADKAFNELYVQNLSYTNVSLKNEVQNGMEAFFDQMAKMEEQISFVKKILMKMFRSELWGIIDVERDMEELEDFPATLREERNERITDQTNQVEEE